MREIIPQDYELLNEEQIEALTGMIDSVPDEDREKILRLLRVDKTARAQRSFLYFVTQMWPVFISGSHHKVMADAFERVAQRLEWGIDPLEAFSDVAPELDGICSALITTYRSGAPIAQSLFGISHAGQHQQHARNLERAEKLGALAIVPVAALQLPAFVISGVVPLAVTQLLPMLGPFTSTTHAM